MIVRIKTRTKGEKFITLATGSEVHNCSIVGLTIKKYLGLNGDLPCYEEIKISAVDIMCVTVITDDGECIVL